MSRISIVTRRLFCSRIVDQDLADKLGRLSALRVQPQDIANLEEDIKLAQRIFEVDTKVSKQL
jgi:hypothetical protein